MADIVRRQDQGVPDTMLTRYKDMTDGTHALVVAASLNAATSDIVPVTGPLTDTQLRAADVKVTLDAEEVQLKRAAAGAYAAAVSVTNAATSIKAAVAARIRLELHHQGPDSAARVWLGADNTLTAGAAGKNFGYLDPGDTWETRDYTGAVYGRTEAGTALISYLEV